MAKEEKNTLSNIASAASMAKGAIKPAKPLPILQKELLRDRMELLLPDCGKADI